MKKPPVRKIKNRDDDRLKVGRWRMIFTASRAGRIASLAGVGKLVLTHFYPECETADTIGQCRKTYDGLLVLAEDLLESSV